MLEYDILIDSLGIGDKNWPKLDKFILKYHNRIMMQNTVLCAICQNNSQTLKSI